MCGNFQTLAARKSLVSVWQGLPGALEDSCWLCGGTTEPTIMPHKEVGGAPALASLNAVLPQSGEVDRSIVDLSSHGYVVALLNQPSCLIRRWAVLPQSGEVDRSNVALSLDHPQKLMQVGVSQDFTLLQGHHYEKKCLTLPINQTGVWRITR